MPGKEDETSSNPPKRPVRPPIDRHFVNRLHHRIKPSARTTFITPGVDVSADMAAIREGRAERSGEYYKVHGRVWFHEEGGRMFPVSGEGLIGPVGRGVIHALRAYARYNGINDLAEYEISRNNGISRADRTEARRIWELREPRR